MTRYGVFVWDADGDIGQAVVAGPFRTLAAAEAKADAIRRYAERSQVVAECGYVQVIVVDLVPGGTRLSAIVEGVV